MKDCIDLYLLWNLFDITDHSEVLGYMSLEISIILNYYAASCKIAIGNGIIEDSDRREKLEISRNFFLDAAKWISSHADVDFSKKKYAKYSYVIQLLKKAVKNNRFPRNS